MVKRGWTAEEDNALRQIVSKLQEENKKPKWVKVYVLNLIEIRNNVDKGKRINIKWLHIVKPKVLFPQKKNIHEDVINDIEKFLEIFKMYKRQWSLIISFYPLQTPNSIKNFFYYSMKKGINNLNRFNTFVKVPRVYETFGEKLLQKLIVLWQQNKNQELIVEDESLFEISHNIIEKIFKCSFHQLSLLKSGKVNEEMEKIYNSLYQEIMTTLKNCKFKKCKAPKKQDKKYQNYDEQIFKKVVRRKKKVVTPIENQVKKEVNLEDVKIEQKQQKVQEPFLQYQFFQPQLIGPSIFQWDYHLNQAYPPFLIKTQMKQEQH